MTEDQRERECLGWLGELGYTHLYEPDIAHDSSDRQRASDREVALAVVAVVPQAPMPLLPMAATSLLALVLIPLSAFVRLTRPLQQRTVKENKHAATCTPQVP